MPISREIQHRDSVRAVLQPHAQHGMVAQRVLDAIQKRFLIWPAKLHTVETQNDFTPRPRTINSQPLPPVRLDRIARREHPKSIGGDSCLLRWPDVDWRG